MKLAVYNPSHSRKPWDEQFNLHLKSKRNERKPSLFWLHFADGKPSEFFLNYIAFSIYDLTTLYYKESLQRISRIHVKRRLAFIRSYSFFVAVVCLFVFRNNTIFVLDKFYISVAPMKSRIVKYYMIHLAWSSNNSAQWTKKSTAIWKVTKTTLTKASSCSLYWNKYV